MDLRRQPNENRSEWGWRLLMHDLRNPKVPLEPQQPEQEVTETAGITNIINNYPAGTRFNYANPIAIITMVIFLIILGILLWRTGALQYIYNTFWSLLI